jgi:aminopeptidase C
MISQNQKKKFKLPKFNILQEHLFYWKKFETSLQQMSDSHFYANF